MSFKIKLDEWVTDSKGNLWHIQGEATVNVSLKGIYVAKYDVILTNTTTNDSYHFQGVLQYNNGDIVSFSGNLYNESGNEVRLSEITDLDKMLAECVNNHL